MFPSTDIPIGGATAMVPIIGTMGIASSVVREPGSARRATPAFWPSDES